MLIFELKAKSIKCDLEQKLADAELCQEYIKTHFEVVSIEGKQELELMNRKELNLRTSLENLKLAASAVAEKVHVKLLIDQKC